MSHGLSPEARAILDAARGGDEPTASDRARVGRAMIAALGGGVATATASTAATAAATATTPGAVGATATAAASGAAAAAGSGGLLKAVLTLVVVGAAAGAVAVEPWSALESAPESARAPSPRATPAAQAPPVRVAPVGVAPPARQEVSAPEPPPAVVERPPPRPLRRRAHAVAAAPSAVAAPAEPPAGRAPPGGLAEELRILHAAHAARRAGNSAGALRLLEEHATHFPRGVLSVEREGSRVLLLCERGPRVEAAAAAARFLASHPSSPMAPRIRSRCEPVAGDPAQPSEP